MTPRKSRKDSSKKNKAFTFYEVPEEPERNDKKAMVSLLSEVKEVIDGFRVAFECTYGVTLSSEEETERDKGLAQLQGLVACYQKFHEEWFWPFINAFKGDLSLVANYDDDIIDDHRDNDLDNEWLPRLRQTLFRFKIKIPRCLYTTSEDYAFLSFGENFFPTNSVNDIGLQGHLVQVKVLDSTIRCGPTIPPRVTGI